MPQSGVATRARTGRRELMEPAVARPRWWARERAAGNLGALGIGVVLLALWQLTSGHLISQLFVSKPTAIASALGELVSSGALGREAPVTLEEAALGFVVGTIPAAILGLIVGRSRLIAAMTRRYIVGFYCSPKLALAPLFIIWFGIGVKMKVYFTATVVFFPVYMTAYIGASEVDQKLLDAIRLMGASRWLAYRHVIIPSTMIWIFAGLRQSLPYALTGAVVGELIAANKGLGYLLSSASAQFDTAKVFAVLFVLVVIGLVSYEAIVFAERKLLKWKTTDRAGVEVEPTT